MSNFSGAMMMKKKGKRKSTMCFMYMENKTDLIELMQCYRGTRIIQICLMPC